MRKYLYAYAAWFAAVLTMAFIAATWYKHVEAIGVRELADKLRERDPDATDATE